MEKSTNQTPRGELLAICLSILAMIVAGISLYTSLEAGQTLLSTSQALSDANNTVIAMQGRLEEVSATLERTNYRLDEIEGRIKRVETMAEWSWTTWSLQSIEWRYYLTEMQQKAAGYNPACVEALPSDKFALTDYGKNLLSSQQTDGIMSMLEANGNVAENNVILKLDIRDLYTYASKKSVPLEVLLGVLTTYIQETRADVASAAS